MAGPGSETQFAQAGLNAPYQYTPVETRLNSPIELHPVDYSGISAAVANLPSNLMQSGLNPAVRAKIQAEAARYKAEGQFISSAANDPKSRGFMGFQGGALTVQPRITSGPAGYTGAAGDTLSGAADTGSTDQGGGQPVTTQPQDTGQTGGQPTVGNFQGVSPTGGVNLGGNYFGGANLGGFGGQPNYFGTPGSGAQPPAAPGGQPQAQGQPTAQPTATPQPQPQAGANDVVMANWQDQNAHPVAPASEALKWAKNNFDTRAQDATYMPHGGPMGQPAYAFHMKGGGTNMVPLQQMVQNGFAANVAGNQTSMTLSAADKVRQQQGQPQGQPQGQQVAQGQQPPQAPGAPVAQTPEQQQYLAQQTQVTTPGGQVNPLLSASTDNQHLLETNQAAYAAAQDSPTAMVTTNPSNVPRAVNPTYRSPAPAGSIQGVADAEVNRQTQAGLKAGIENMPNAPGDNPGGLKVAARMDNGITWYVDPNEPSHVPFLIYNTTPWSESRMPNDGKWQTYEHVYPDKLLDKQIYDNLHQDSSGWSKADKINALRENYWEHTSTPLSEENSNKLHSLREQVLYSQRIMDAVDHMDPGDWGWLAQKKNTIAAHQYDFKGMPVVDGLMKGVSKVIAGGEVDPRLTHLMQAYASLKGGASNSYLTGEERDALKSINLDATLKDNIKGFNHDRMAEYNQYVNTALANRFRMDPDLLQTAQSITNQKHIQDTQNYDYSKVPSSRVGDTQPPAAPGGGAGGGGTYGSRTNPAPIGNDTTSYNNLPMYGYYLDSSGQVRQKVPKVAPQPNQGAAPAPSPQPTQTPAAPRAQLVQPGAGQQARRALPVNP